MTSATLLAIRSLLASDPPKTAADRKALSEVMGGTKSEFGGIVTRKEAAALLRVVPQTIDRFAREGMINRVRLPGRKHGLGYRKDQLLGLVS